MSAAGLQPVKWTKSQFVDLYEHGFLDPAKRYELIEGDILERMSPIGRQHALAMQKLSSAFSSQVSEMFEVGTAGSVELSDSSMPEPDVYVARIIEDQEASRFTKVEDVVLVAEISDSTLGSDRGVKRKIYAEALIPEYWIVNLNNRTVEIYRKPILAEYSETQIIQESELISPQFDPAMKLAAKKFFPKA